jgi:hypothetical protein
MTEIECGIKAYDVHELFTHFLAERLGYYRDAVLADVLRESDETAAATFELMRHCFTIDGIAKPSLLSGALAARAQETPAATHVQPSDLYDFSLLESVAR